MRSRQLVSPCFPYLAKPVVLSLLAALMGCARVSASDNGQTGSVGSAECQVDADCRREAEAIVAQLRSEGFDAETRTASCVTGGLCDTVIRREDDCFVDSPYGVAYDCGDSDEQILAAEAARQEQEATCGGQGCVQVPPPEYHPRDPMEWDGMPVPLQGPSCETSEYCGLALACVEQMCGACAGDRDCAAGEACVVEHCLRAELITCHSYRDCEPNQVCILSGITGGTARGNEDMRSYCQ
jgi:hypothetical protein